MYTYIFKTKKVGDFREWSDIPSEVVEEITPGEAARLAAIASRGGDVLEIRYNNSLSPQGYYVPGSMGAWMEHHSR